MKEAIQHTVCYLVSSADIYGFRKIFARVDVVDKPTFPRSGLMDKKGIYAAWNAKVSPFAVWGLPATTRFYWYQTLEAAKTAIQQHFYNEIYHGATFMDVSDYERENKIATARYFEDQKKYEIHY